jgi:hypothetical protein
MNRLDHVTSLIEASVPIAGDLLSSMLVRQRLLPEQLSLRDLASLFVDAGRSPPFRIIRRKGVEVAVPLGGVRLTTSILSTAAHAVSSWGIATIHAIADRVAALTSHRPSLVFASRTLIAAPGFKWLDQPAGWFSFANSSSRMAHVVTKLFSVAASIEFDELRGAIVKALPMTLTAPPHVLLEYLRQVCGCQLRGYRVSAGDGTGRQTAKLTPVERKLTHLLRAMGGTLTLQNLRARALELAMPWRTVARALRTSPLFVLTGSGRVSIVGAT